MTSRSITPNAPWAWLHAARPQTLTGALTPVIIALALAMHEEHHLIILPAILCALFALVMQIDANFINDYFDSRRGADDPATRLGPARACTMGWITPRAMRRAIALTTTAACAIGAPLIVYGGWTMVLIGAACVLFCFLYTTTLAARGLGDVLVIVFFGLVPVCVTYYLQTSEITRWVVVLALTCGAVIDNLLIVNNYRDLDNDRRNNKLTLAVIIGKQATLTLYFFLGAAATLVIFIYTHFDKRAVLILLYLLCHCHTYGLLRTRSGKELNTVLAATARNNLFFGLLTAIIALL